MSVAQKACVSYHKAQLANERRMLNAATDKDIQGWLGWPEFAMDMHDLNVCWRRFCGNVRREAYKRGLL